jgi:arabinoxylan arabinofuranohydrolase
MKKLLVVVLVALVISSTMFFSESQAINPFVQNRYTADPSARVFTDPQDNKTKLYVYTCHDKNNPDWFDMEDYYVYSTEDLATWKEHGPILSLDEVLWAKKWMWSPDCAYKNGVYYLYFPASTRMDSNKDNPKYPDFRIGVATGTSPTGPFTPDSTYIQGTDSVDPSVFRDTDGQAYLFWGGNGHGKLNYPKYAKLKSDMKTLDGTPQEIKSGLDGWYQGAFIFKRGSIYYLVYSTGGDKSELRYATSSSIQGTWNYGGVVLSDVIGYTNHGSIVEFPVGSGKWYVFYHDSEMSPTDALNQRCIKFMPVTFDKNGKMAKVNALDPVATRSPMATNAFQKIQAQFWSEVSRIGKHDIQLEATQGDCGQHVSWLTGPLGNVSDVLLYRNLYLDSQGRSGSLVVQVACPDGKEHLKPQLKIQVFGSNYWETTINIPSTGGWQKFKYITIPIASLPHGSFDLRFEVLGIRGYIDVSKNTLYNIKSFQFK